MKDFATMRRDIDLLFKAHEVDYYIVGFVADGGNVVTQSRGDDTVLAPVLEEISGAAGDSIEDMTSQIEELESEKSDLEDEVTELEHEIEKLKEKLEALEK